MITDTRCTNCNQRYEITWEDAEEEYFSDVEDTDQIDYDDYDKEEFPQYGPFCGTHESYDGEL